MNYKKHVLANGLRVITVPMPSLESVTVTVWVKVGSRFERPKIAGISHFLEHMAFKGGRKYKDANEVAEILESYGVLKNAATSKEWTNYWVKGRADVMDKALDVLSDMVLYGSLRQKDIERERGVILEEIAMYEDLPMVNIGNIFERSMFCENQLGVDTIGTKQTVRGVVRKDFVDYVDRYYYPENMLLTVAGGMREEDMVSLLRKYFGRMKKREGRAKYETYTSRQSSPRVKLSSKKVDQAHVMLGFRGYERSNEDRWSQTLLSIILGGGMSSRLFTEIREKRGLAYAIHTSTESYMDTGTFATYGGIRLSKVSEAIKIILDQHYGLRDKKYAVRVKELAKAKEFYKGDVAIALEDTSVVNDFFAMQELFLDKVLTPEEVYRQIDKVSVGDVYRVANELFVPERLNLAIIGPYSDEDKFSKLIS